MRVLATVWDGGGNLPPLLGLTQALVSRGHEVRILAHRTQRASLEAAGGLSHAFEHAGEFDGANPSVTDGRAFFEWLMIFDGRAVEDMARLAALTEPDILLIDAMLPRTLTAGIALGSPAVSLVHSAWSGLVGVAGGVFAAATEASGLALVFSQRAFDHISAGKNFVWVGPARGRSAPTTWRRQRADLPLVLASVSSSQQGQGAVLANLAAALSAPDFESLLTVGRAYDPATFRSGPTLTITKDVPHDQVLGQANLMVTHAGHGAVMAAIRAGVPMLCLPGVGDQPFNARRVAELGLGEVLNSDAGSDVITSAVRRLLADGDLQARSRAFARTVAPDEDLNVGIARLEALAAR